MLGVLKRTCTHLTDLKTRQIFFKVNCIGLMLSNSWVSYDVINLTGGSTLNRDTVIRVN